MNDEGFFGWEHNDAHSIVLEDAMEMKDQNKNYRNSQFHSHDHHSSSTNKNTPDFSSDLIDLELTLAAPRTMVSRSHHHRELPFRWGQLVSLN